MDVLSALSGAGNLVTPAGQYPANIVRQIERCRFSLSNEKALQAEIARELRVVGLDVRREVRLRDAPLVEAGGAGEAALGFASLNPGYGADRCGADRDIVDLMVDDVAIEVKIKGSKREIYRQIERYCGHAGVAALILATRIEMMLPPFVDRKPCYVALLTRAWL